MFPSGEINTNMIERRRDVLNAEELAEKVVEKAARIAADVVAEASKTAVETLSSALVLKDIEYIKNDISEIKNKLEAQYVSKPELRLLEQKHETLQRQADFTQKIVYGTIGLIAVAVISALVRLVVK